MYAPYNNPEMQERREECGRGREHREHGRRGRGGPRGFAEGRPEGGFDGRRGRGGRGGRPEFTPAGVTLRAEMGLLRGAAVAVGTGGTPEQVAKAEAILAEARRSLFELLAQKPAETEPAAASAAE